MVEKLDTRRSRGGTTFFGHPALPRLLVLLHAGITCAPYSSKERAINAKRSGTWSSQPGARGQTTSFPTISCACSQNLAAQWCVNKPNTMAFWTWIRRQRQGRREEANGPHCQGCDQHATLVRPGTGTLKAFGVHLLLLVRAILIRFVGTQCARTRPY